MPPPRGIVQRLDQSLHRSNLLPPRARLLVAVSGGADSVALLRLLHGINQSKHWQWKLMVGHVEHGIRGRSSKADAQFVARLAKGLRLRFVSRSLRLGKGASEDSARAARFRAIHALLKEAKATAVVLAHHADDQAETMLQRLFRGTGFDGLVGIQERVIHIFEKDKFVTALRPLLHFRRQELRAYLREIHQPWREDETNASDTYLRNRIRHHLLPEIERLFPAATEALARLAALARLTNSFVSGQMAELRERVLMDEMPNLIRFKVNEELLIAHSAVVLALLRNFIVRLGGSSESADYERLEKAFHAIHRGRGNKTIQLGNRISLHLARGIATLIREDPREEE